MLMIWMGRLGGRHDVGGHGDCNGVFVFTNQQMWKTPRAFLTAMRFGTVS